MKIEYVPFDEAFVSEPVGRYKIKESEYKYSGLIKVVDQGQNLISGFTNRTDLIRKNTPYIVFGDHTKAIKFVDFQFVVGADGVRLYRPREGFDAEFLFYFLRSTKLPSDGYGRHSKYLSELSIPKTDLKNQQRITGKLKTQLAEVETARKALQAQQAEIKLFAATALDELYSHADKVKMGNVAKIQSGYAFKSKDFKTQGIKLLRNTNILPNRIYWDDMACLPSELITEYPNYVLNEGDVILSLDRPIISTGLKVARISNKDIPALLVQRVGRFLIDTNKLDPSYLYFFLNTSFFKNAISGHEQSLGVPHISPSQVESVDIPLPDVDEQKIIATKALEIFRQTNIAKIAAKEAQKDIDYLSSRLLAQAFDTHPIE
jgi:type I restriction enzyme S subunit